MIQNCVEVKLNHVLEGRKLVIIWPLATFFFAVIGGLILGVPKYYLLSVRGAAAEGVIVALHPEDHGSVLYEYKVGGQSFSGGGHAGDVSSKFDQLRLDQPLPVFYDPRELSISCLGPPRKHLNSLLSGTIFIAAFPTFAIGVLKIKQIIREPSR